MGLLDDDTTTTRTPKLSAKRNSKPPTPPSMSQSTTKPHKSPSQRITKEGRLTITDAWSTIKRHANSDLKKRYRELMKEML